jgi:predicted RNase H-like HicB family nuclease
MKLVYPAIFSPLENESGYCVTFPDLCGAVTQGDDLANSIEMAVDCASGWVLDELESGNPAPKATPVNEIQLESKDDFINLVVLDMDAYAEKYGQKAIRKNCTIPAWLNTISEREHINFSAVLQDALVEKLHLNNA